MTPALQRLARCRHPRDRIRLGLARQDCCECGSARTSQDSGYHWSRWTRPKLVADLIAGEKKGRER